MGGYGNFAGCRIEGPSLMRATLCQKSLRMCLSGKPEDGFVRSPVCPWVIGCHEALLPGYFHSYQIKIRSGSLPCAIIADEW